MAAFVSHCFQLSDKNSPVKSPSFIIPKLLEYKAEDDIPLPWCQSVGLYWQHRSWSKGIQHIRQHSTQDLASDTLEVMPAQLQPT